MAHLNDLAIKSSDLGLIDATTEFAGNLIQPATPAWFEFETPRESNVPREVVLQSPFAGTITVALYDSDPSTSSPYSTTTGTGTLTIPYSSITANSTTSTTTYWLELTANGASTTIVAGLQMQTAPPPAATGQSVITGENDAAAVTLAASASTGDSLTYTILSGPAHGKLSGTAPNLTYTPTTGYSGPDSITFEAFDGVLASNVATVTIAVVAPPTSSVASLPAVINSISIPLSWSGTDSAAGGGIVSYDIYDSTNNGPFKVLLTNTTSTSTTFTGVFGDSYGFYSVATDKAGITQPTPSGRTGHDLAPGSVGDARRCRPIGGHRRERRQDNHPLGHHDHRRYPDLHDRTPRRTGP